MFAKWNTFDFAVLSICGVLFGFSIWLVWDYLPQLWAVEQKAEQTEATAGKYIISADDAYALLRGCCVGAGGAWAQDQKCVANWDQGEAFYSCATSKKKDTYIRYRSGNVEILNARDFMR